MLRFVPGLIILAFMIYSAVDCIQTPEREIQHLPKLLWILLIVVVPIVGGAAWFLSERHQQPPTRRQMRPPAPRGPDDDPDFLRNL